MSTWRRDVPADVAEQAAAVLLVLKSLSQSSGGDTIWLRNGDSGSFAVIVDWAAVRESEDSRVTLASPETQHRQLALVDTDSLVQTGGLLRYCDLVGVVRGPGTPAPSPPAGLVSSGELRVSRGTEDALRIDLFRAAPVDRRGFTMGAPVDFQDSEDLDARADWFRKRHDPDRN
ncbi:MAG: hypothetical protein AAFY29_23565 [Pseudomonadota bacterium]